MTQRKDGRWQENVFIGTVDGVPKYKTVSGKTKKEVKQKALDLKIKNKQGIDILSGDRTLFSFWADAWLLSVKDAQTKENHKLLMSRTQVWKNLFECEKIENIRAVDCQVRTDEIAKSNPRYPNKPSSAKTVVEYCSVLNRIFEFCIENRVLTYNPCKYVKIPKGLKRHEREAISNDEIKYFTETEHPLQTCAMLMIYAGLRRGEAIALTWNDIDFVNRTITINKSFNFKSQELKPPKTKAGYRTIPMCELLCNYLQLKKSNTLLVAYNDRMTEGIWQKKWNNYIKAINDKYKIEFSTTPHCLRHTYCTLLYEADVDVLTAKEIMGHSDISVTMKIYTHLREQHKKLSADKLNKYLEKM